MIQNPVKEGLKVQIEINTGSFTAERTVIDCFIVNSEPDRLTLSFPAEKSEYIPYLSEGTEIKAFVYTFNGILILNSIVYDEPIDGQIVIEFNEDHRTIQRRKYLRVAYSTDMFITGENGNIKVSTIDISGGGIRFQTDKLLKDGQNLCVQLKLNSFEPIIKIDGVVLKKSFFQDDEFVLEFTQIDETDRNRIVSKCMEIEREQQRKLNY